MATAPCLRVPKKLGQKALYFARKLDIVNEDLKIGKDGKYVFIPLARALTREKNTLLQDMLEEMEVQRRDFLKRSRRAQSLSEALMGKLPPHLLGFLPRSVDIIGSVAMLMIPFELKRYEELLGKAIVEMHRGVETVLAKAGPVNGEQRLRKYRAIYGSGKTETIYRENGCIYHLDPTKVFFSPRLSHERSLISKQVKEGEVVIDLFTGIGPLSIQIGKKRINIKVYAIDINPFAYRYLKRNIIANRVEERVAPILGDARDVIKEKRVEVADRAIMNLPKRAAEFVDVACRVLKKGGILHFYSFESDPDALGKAEKKLIRSVVSSGRVADNVIGYRLVKEIAPHKWQVAIDLRVL